MSNISHRYELNSRQWRSELGGPLLCVAVLILLLHVITYLPLFPAPYPALDADRTVIWEQTAVAEEPSRLPDAGLLLMGDSSCLMDADAGLLSRASDQPAWNLGLVSFLSLREQAALVGRLPLAHRHTVLLLMSPVALQRHRPGEFHKNLFYSALNRKAPAPSTRFENLLRACGLLAVRNHISARCVPQVLPDSLARTYGFTPVLARSLRQGGGLVASGFLRESQTPAIASYRWPGSLPDEARLFRDGCAGSRLLVALTPVPASMAPADWAQAGPEQALQWGDWLKADEVLTGLPLVWPDEYFADNLHLNARGRARYTRLLANAVASAQDHPPPGQSQLRP